MIDDRHTSVGARFARAHFGELLARVQQGAEVTITRRGMPVARLIPVRTAATPTERQAAIAAMRTLATNNRLQGVRVKDLIAEGRR